MLSPRGAVHWNCSSSIGAPAGMGKARAVAPADACSQYLAGCTGTARAGGMPLVLENGHQLPFTVCCCGAVGI